VKYYLKKCLCYVSGELFAQCPVESYPSGAIEQVLDSSRYFVMRIQDGGGNWWLFNCCWLGNGWIYNVGIQIYQAKCWI